MKYLRWFYTASTIFFIFGAVVNIASNQSDVYQLWFGGALVSGLVLIEEKT